MLVIDINKRKVIQLLQNKVAGIVQNLDARMIAGSFQKALKSSAVVQVFAGVDFVADVYPIFIKHIQNGLPPVGQFLKSHFNESGGAFGARDT